MALSNLDSHDRDSDVSSMVNRTFDELLRHVQDYPRSVWIIQSSPRKIDRSKFAHLVTRTDSSSPTSTPVSREPGANVPTSGRSSSIAGSPITNQMRNLSKPGRSTFPGLSRNKPPGPRLLFEGIRRRRTRRAHYSKSSTDVQGSVPDSKPARMAAWFARHRGDLDSPRNSDENHEDFPGPGAVAWMLWEGTQHPNPCGRPNGPNANHKTRGIIQ